MTFDNAPLRRAKSPKIRCRHCVSEFRRTRIYRECAVHPGTGLFQTYNTGCASASKIRWVLRARGVQAMHPECAGAVQVWTMTVGEDERLIGVWLAGRARTVFLGMVRGNAVEPLHIDDMERVLKEHGVGIEHDDQLRKESVEWTR